jgi:hypothetical protein
VTPLMLRHHRRQPEQIVSARADVNARPVDRALNFDDAFDVEMDEPAIKCLEDDVSGDEDVAEESVEDPAEWDLGALAETQAFDDDERPAVPFAFEPQSIAVNGRTFPLTQEARPTDNADAGDLSSALTTNLAKRRRVGASASGAPTLASPAVEPIGQLHGSAAAIIILAELICSVCLRKCMDEPQQLSVILCYLQAKQDNQHSPILFSGFRNRIFVYSLAQF